jgi:type I restriction enzyme S subunit
MTAALRAEERAAPYLVAPLLTDQLDTFAGAPEGFKRLRELVLNLAVRGRLVPQDPKDQPAAEFLARIRAEKERLIAAGKIKRDKPLPAIGENNLPFDVPLGWQWANFGDAVLSSEAGWSPSCENMPRENGKWGVLKVSAVSWGTFLDEENKALPSHLEVRPEHEVMPGDFLLSRANTAELVARSVVAWSPMPRLMLSDKVIRLHIATGVDKAYFNLFNNSSFARAHYVANASGTSASMKNVSREVVLSLPVPVPPAAEQSRIVAKVEELMALIAALEAKVGAGGTARGRLLDALLAALADSPDAAATAEAWAQLAPHFDLLLQTPADVDRLQQTLLQLAVKGRLVPQDPNDDPAAELLKRIRAEKERLVADGKIKRDKPLPAIGEDEKPYDLPNGWQWARVPAIADTRLGKMLDKAKNRGHLKPYLRNTNVQWFHFDLSDVKELRLEDAELSELRVLPGDLLICEGGEPGRCAIWKDVAREIYFQKALHRVRTYCGVLVEFVQLCLRVDCVTGRLDEFFTGATIKHFPGQALDEYCVPLPPLAEQSRIVAAVASLTALCDRLRERLAARRALSAKLAAALTESALQ